MLIALLIVARAVHIAASILAAGSFTFEVVALGAIRRPVSAASLLRRNLLVYGLGGVLAPFPGIWIIDQILVAFHLA